MDKFNNITPTLLKKRIIQRAKNLLFKLSLFKPEDNNSSLKNEIQLFFREKNSTEEEAHIKETISIVFYEELNILGVISDYIPKKFYQIEEQKKQSPEKKESIEKNKQEMQNMSIYRYRKLKKK
jgi:hypothetical protein